MKRFQTLACWLAKHGVAGLSAVPYLGIGAPVIGLLTIGLLTVPLMAGSALAQNQITGGVLGPGSATAGAGGQTSKPVLRRPSALPGSRTEKNETVPADRIASDMAPNEALFDGINRGDMVYVKDAISRGADLNARNILGLTPIDLAVDLGRNDITFLLLSMRGSSGSGAPAAPGSGKSVKALLQEANKAPPKAPKATRAAREAAPATAGKPKLFANDGGAPVPNAGFLGFGSQR